MSEDQKQLRDYDPTRTVTQHTPEKVWASFTHKQEPDGGGAIVWMALCILAACIAVVVYAFNHWAHH